MRRGQDEAPHGGTYNFTTVSLKKKGVNKSEFIIKRLYSIYKDLYINVYVCVLDNKVSCGSKQSVEISIIQLFKIK